MRPNGHEEEPKRQSPQPQAAPVCHDHGYLPRQRAGDLHEFAHRADDAREVVAHVDYPGDGEPRGTDADEHTRAKRFFRQLLRHEPVEEGAVDHQRDEEPDALDDETSDYYIQGGVAAGFGTEIAGVRAYDEERVGGEYPDGRHLGDCECLRGPPEVG